MGYWIGDVSGGSSPVNSLCGGCGVPLITGWAARNNQGMTWVIINHTVTQVLLSSEDTKVLGLVVLLDLGDKSPPSGCSKMDEGKYTLMLKDDRHCRCSLSRGAAVASLAAPRKTRH